VAPLFHEDQRVWITLSAPNSNGNTEFYGTVTGVVGQVVTISPDDPLDEVTANITLVEVGLDPTGQPISIESIYNFASEVIAVAGSTDASMRRVDTDPAIAITNVDSGTQFKVAGTDRFALWLEARVSFNGATPVDASVVSITPGADPEVDETTIVVAVDGAGSIDAGATEVDVITPAKDEASVFDDRGQLRGAGVPLATVAFEESTELALNEGSYSTYTFADIDRVPDVMTVTARCKSASGGYDVDDEVILNTGIDNGGTNQGMVVVATATGVSVRAHDGNGTEMLQKGNTSNKVTISDTTAWRIVVRCVVFDQISVP
jgi:hypothetical protein